MKTTKKISNLFFNFLAALFILTGIALVVLPTWIMVHFVVKYW